MIERHLIVPVVPETLWEALTDPQEVGAWFGHQVEWELTPGAPARWTDTDGAGQGRVGVVEEVAPARRLRFRWWPESDEGPASEVTYELEPAPDDPECTHLTVREAPLPERPETSARARAATSANATVAWDMWDTRHAGLWIRLHSPARVGA